MSEDTPSKTPKHDADPKAGSDPDPDRRPVGDPESPDGSSPPRGGEVSREEDARTDPAGESPSGGTGESSDPGKETDEASGPAGLERLQAQLEEKQAQLEERDSEIEKFRDDRARLLADMDNYRKRVNRDRKYANQTLMEELLPVLDNFHLALGAIGQATDEEGTASPRLDSLRKGVEMVFQGLQSVLVNSGLKEIDARSGERFDTKFHEAAATEETLLVEEDHIVRQLRKGYEFRERLIRPAHVVVARLPAEPEEGDRED